MVVDGWGPGGGGNLVTSVAVQEWLVTLDLYRLLDLTPEAILLFAQYPSLIEGETMACVHDVFTDCLVFPHLCVL